MYPLSFLKITCIIFEIQKLPCPNIPEPAWDWVCLGRELLGGRNLFGWFSPLPCWTGDFDIQILEKGNQSLMSRFGSWLFQSSRDGWMLSVASAVLTPQMEELFLISAEVML